MTYLPGSSLGSLFYRTVLICHRALNAIINDKSQFMLKDRLGGEELPGSSWANMLRFLKTVRALPLELKMKVSLILKVDVEYTGSSSIAGGKLLAIVERHLERLKNSK